ncbi:hypothetical protein Ancab_011028 [Ancistrocladus abbreviatus]
MASPARDLEAILMEDTTEFAVWTEREGKAAMEEEKGMTQRTKTTQISLQKDLEGTVSKGASTAVGLDELGPNSLSPQVDHRRKKAACSPGPRKPKQDGVRRKFKSSSSSHRDQPLVPYDMQVHEHRGFVGAAHDW